MKWMKIDADALDKHIAYVQGIVDRIPEGQIDIRDKEERERYIADMCNIAKLKSYKAIRALLKEIE